MDYIISALAYRQKEIEMLIQRTLTRNEADKLIKHLSELEVISGDKPREYQYINGKVGDWRMCPDGQSVFYCPPYYGYEEEV